MLEPLYTAEEMRAAEARYPGYPETASELMDRAGRAVATEVATRYPDAQFVVAVCGGGSNGGDGRIAAEILQAMGRETIVVEPGGSVPSCDVVIDALFGTGFHGEPRAEAAGLIEEINAAGCPVVAIDGPSGVDPPTGEVAGASVEADVKGTMHGSKVARGDRTGRFPAREVVWAGAGLR